MQPSKRASALRVKLLLASKLLVALPLALLAAMPARAEFLPPADQVMQPDEMPQLMELLQQLEPESFSDSKSTLAVLDATLAKLREPTKLRGVIQFYRAATLIDQNREAEAVAAIEESIRLLPGYSGPLITAAWTYSYSERPGRGADYLLRAIQVDPKEARKVPDYEIDNLITRLRNAEDDRRVEAVSEGLLKIGWIGTNVSSRSSLALTTIKRRMTKGDVAGARELVPQLVVPGQSRALLRANAYKDIWGDIEKWGGPKLEKQWAIYLAEARARWVASQSLETLKDYSSALMAADHGETVIREIFPLYLQPIDPIESYDLIFVAGDVVRALAEKGRWKEIDTLYSNAEAAWPLGSDANALNISANRAKWLLYQGSFEEALKRIDAAIADARKWGPEVNSDALAGMLHYRACMLHELGRNKEAQLSAAAALAGSKPDNAAHLHLCMDDVEAARKALIAALSNADTRDDVLGFVQKSDDPPVASDYGRKRRAKIDALRSDPVLLSEVAKYGRVLPYTSSEGAPPENQ